MLSVFPGDRRDITPVSADVVAQVVAQAEKQLKLAKPATQVHFGLCSTCYITKKWKCSEIFFIIIE